MTQIELKQLPGRMWVVDAAYTIKWQDGVESVTHHFYGPFPQEATGKKVRTWATKVGKGYEGKVAHDTLNPGYLTVEVTMLETQTLWVKSDK